MISSLTGTLRWSLSLGAKFARVVPTATLLIVGLTLISQISMLVASLLPLKVVILLGSERIPGYFPQFLSVFGHNTLIALLSAVTVGIFLLHLLAERLIVWRTAEATRKLLAMSEKMTLFERQDDIAREAYQRFSHALASGVFIFVSLTGLAFFYPSMVLIQLLYALFVFFILWLLQQRNVAFREQLQARPNHALNLSAGIGFFVAFAWLVLDFIFFTPPAVIVSILALLLTRQIMSRASSIVVDFYSLQKQRAKLDALFFHGKVLMPELPDADGIWGMLDPAARDKWLPDVLLKLGLLKEEDTNPVNSYWQQVGPLNVGALRVHIGSNTYLLKLYDTNRTSWALHELALLEQQVPNLPGLQLAGSTRVGNYLCLVCTLPEGQNPELATIKASEKQVRISRMAASPPDALIQDYQRSMPMLWQRLNRPFLSCLYVAADTSKKRQLLESLFERLPELHNLLESLPLAIQAADFGSDALLWELPDGHCLSLYWGQWTLEPVGAGWPESVRELPRLSKALEQASQVRCELDSVTLAQAQAAALAFALERLCGRQRYTHAMALIPGLLERMDEQHL